MSHGFQLGVSYTYSHATDEQSALGLFYQRQQSFEFALRAMRCLTSTAKHAVTSPTATSCRRLFASSSLKGKIANGWAISGSTIIQSGQPYSVVDYSARWAASSTASTTGSRILLSRFPAAHPSRPVTGSSGTHPVQGVENSYALRARCFGLPLLNPGDLNGAIPSNDPYEDEFH